MTLKLSLTHCYLLRSLSAKSAAEYDSKHTPHANIYGHAHFGGRQLVLSPCAGSGSWCRTVSSSMLSILSLSLSKITWAKVGPHGSASGQFSMSKSTELGSIVGSHGSGSCQLSMSKSTELGSVTAMVGRSSTGVDMSLVGCRVVGVAMSSGGCGECGGCGDARGAAVLGCIARSTVIKFSKSMEFPIKKYFNFFKYSFNLVF